MLRERVAPQSEVIRDFFQSMLWGARTFATFFESKNSRSSSISSSTRASDILEDMSIEESVPARIPKIIPPASSVMIATTFSVSVTGVTSP